MLWLDPYPSWFSLSMVKASQRNLVQSLHKANPDVHVALLNVAGQVSKGHEYLSPPAIAEKFWELYSQKKENWTLELTIGEEQ